MVDLDDHFIQHYNERLPEYVARHAGEYVLLQEEEEESSYIRERFFPNAAALQQARSTFPFFEFAHQIPRTMRNAHLQTLTEVLDAPDVIDPGVVRIYTTMAFREMRSIHIHEHNPGYNLG